MTHRDAMQLIRENLERDAYGKREIDGASYRNVDDESALGSQP